MKEIRYGGGRSGGSSRTVDQQQDSSRTASRYEVARGDKWARIPTETDCGESRRGSPIQPRVPRMHHVSNVSHKNVMKPMPTQHANFEVFLLSCDGPRSVAVLVADGEW